MVQIIQAQPTAQTLRQQAFQQGLDQIGQGVVGFANAMDQRTQREQALNTQAINSLIQSGEEVTPAKIETIKSAHQAPVQSGFSSLFSGQKQPVSSEIIIPKSQKKQFEDNKLKYESEQLNKPFDQRDDFLKAKKLKELEVKTTNNTPGNTFKSLPKDKQNTIDILSDRNAKKASIANQIDAVMKTWDKLSDDEKYYQGSLLLKTLNSPEGADAIGKEEAGRIGSNLEFAFGNIFSDNPLQLGRDLPGFKTQSEQLSNSLKEAIKQNTKLIDDAYGRSSTNAISKTQEDELKELEELRKKKAQSGIK